MKNLDPSFDPSCCSYKLSGKLRSQIEKLIGCTDVPENTRSKLSELMKEVESSKDTLSYDYLTSLHKYLQHADPDTYSEPFYLFQEKCKCIKPKPRDNKQLESRLRMLRLKNSQAIYNRMAVTVDRLIERRVEQESVDGNDCSTKELRLFSGSMMAVINSFLVYICTFIFCYKALEYALPQPHIVGQVLFGLFGSTVVACAELYFLARVI